MDIPRVPAGSPIQTRHTTSFAGRVLSPPCETTLVRPVQDGTLWRCAENWKEQLPARAGAASTMAMLSAYAADICHVAPVATNGQSAFAGDFPLLFRTHGGKSAPALLLPASRGCARAPGGGTIRRTAPGGGGTAPFAVAPLHRTSGVAFLFHFVPHAGTSASRPAGAPGCALAVWLFGVDALGLRRAGRAAEVHPGFRDGKAVFVLTQV